METKQPTTANAIVLAGIFIGGAILLSSGLGRASFRQPSQVANAKLAVGNSSDSGTEIKISAEKINMSAVDSADHILGDPKAPLVIVEYADFECPWCKIFYTTLHQIVSAYGGKVTWVYRHFPIPSLHPKAFKEAEASECAAKLGGEVAFWKYADQIYSVTPSNNGLDPAILPKIAKDIGLNETAFNSCLNSGLFTKKISQARLEGQAAGAQATPYSIIVTHGLTYPINQGALPIEVMRQVVDGLLKQ